MRPFYNFPDPKLLTNYLRNVLIPDLIESGSDATAQDFADCATHIEQLTDPVTPSETVTRHKHGTGAYDVNVRELSVPDLWHIAHNQGGDNAAKALILETWHIAHDLKNHIIDTL